VSGESENVPPGWVSVGKSIRNRRHEIKMSQEKLAALSAISLSTIKEIEKHEKYRERAEDTLKRISSALGLERSYLDDVLAGRAPEYSTIEPEKEPTLSSLRDMLVEFSGKLNAIEEHIENIDISLANLASQAKRPDINYPISTSDVSPDLESPDAGADTPSPF
jgi:transcriptional regulator with XRE-family HTH domain